MDFFNNLGFMFTQRNLYLLKNQILNFLNFIDKFAEDNLPQNKYHDIQEFYLDMFNISLLIQTYLRTSIVFLIHTLILRYICIKNTILVLKYV